MVVVPLERNLHGRGAGGAYRAGRASVRSRTERDRPYPPSSDVTCVAVRVTTSLPIAPEEDAVEPIALTAAADANPAGGAAVWEAILATGVAVLDDARRRLRVGWAHRTGRISFLGAAAERRSRAHRPARLGGAPVDDHRRLADRRARRHVLGHLAPHRRRPRRRARSPTPPHFLILFGLFGVFIAGFCAIVLPEGRPSRAAIRIGGDWYAPLGGIGLLAASALRAARLPARRLLAPDLRPGRDALGPDPPDDDRRRRARLHRPGDAARRGAAVASASPIARRRARARGRRRRPTASGCPP